MDAEGARVSLLVTGGSGYLGQHTLRHFGSLPWVASLSYTYRTAPLAAIAQAVGHQVDFSTATVDDIRAVLRAARPDVVIHTAALSGLGQCEKDPEAALRVNSPGALLEALVLEAPDALVVYISTDQVYGQHARANAPPFTEAHARAPLNAYGATKLAFETALEEHATMHAPHFRYVTLRSSNIIGAPAPYTRAGKFLQWLQGALCAASAAAADGDGGGGGGSGRDGGGGEGNGGGGVAGGGGGGANALALFSDELRNFVDVDDIVRVLATLAAAAAAPSPPPLPLNRAYNMGGAAALSRAQLGALCTAALGAAAARARIIAAPRGAAVPHPSPLDLSMDSGALWGALKVAPAPAADAVRRGVAAPLPQDGSARP